MFAVECPLCGLRRLMSFSEIVAMRNVEQGRIEVEYECVCGMRGMWRTGRFAG